MDLNAGNEQWLDAQYSVLGSALISPEVVPKIIEGTTERDYFGTCRTVYKAIRKLFIEGVDVDPVSVRDVLGGKYTDFLLQLMDITPTAANVDRYIALCREQSQVAGLRELAQQMIDASTADQMRDLLEKANSLMISKPRMRIVTMAQAMKEFMDDQTKPTNYMSWPIPELNQVLYAEPGDFIVIGGFPSAGKTAFALQCLWHIAKTQKVGFFSLETQSKKLFARQISGITGISMQDIKRHTLSQTDWDRLCQQAGRIAGTDIELLDAAGCTLEDIRAVTLMRRYQVIFVDYLQLIHASGYNRTEQVTSISLGLHTLAQTLGVTVVALSQLSRNPNEERNKLPDLSRLRESGQIEQDADVVLMLSLKDSNDRDGNRILQIAKNKEGTRPDMVLSFNGETQTFAKAQQTGAVVSKYVAEGKMARQRNRAAAQQNEQLSILPQSTPVPFTE